MVVKRCLHFPQNDLSGLTKDTYIYIRDIKQKMEQEQEKVESGVKIVAC